MAKLMGLTLFIIIIFLYDISIAEHSGYMV